MRKNFAYVLHLLVLVFLKIIFIYFILVLYINSNCDLKKETYYMIIFYACYLYLYKLIMELIRSLIFLIKKSRCFKRKYNKTTMTTNSDDTFIEIYSNLVIAGVLLTLFYIFCQHH